MCKGKREREGQGRKSAQSIYKWDVICRILWCLCVFKITAVSALAATTAQKIQQNASSQFDAVAHSSRIFYVSLVVQNAGRLLPGRHCPPINHCTSLCCFFASQWQTLKFSTPHTHTDDALRLTTDYLQTNGKPLLCHWTQCSRVMQSNQKQAGKQTV